jgi:hypothetical protein
VEVALLDTRSLLEGAFLLSAHRVLLVSDTCIMVRCGGRNYRVLHSAAQASSFFRGIHVTAPKQSTTI